MSLTNPEALAKICKHYGERLAECGNHKQARAETANAFNLSVESVDRYLTFQRSQDSVVKVETDISQDLLSLLKKRKMTLVELADHFGVAPKEITAGIESLKSSHRLISNDSNGLIYLDNIVLPTPNSHRIDIRKHAEKEIAFGAVADSHLCSNYERLDVLHALYDKFESYGIDTVFHAGNIIDGEASFNKHDIHVHGFGNQVRYCVKNYPQRHGIVTKYVTGDDHEGWYSQREGIDFGKYLEFEAREAGRTDLEYIGHMERDIELEQDEGSAIIRVIHAGGGSSYAISYSEQKYVESLQGGEKPKIVLIGHYHKFNQGYPREVHTVQVGCTQNQTPFMRKKKLQAMVGGCIIRLKQNTLGIITEFNVTWIPFYDKKFYEYKW